MALVCPPGDCKGGLPGHMGPPGPLGMEGMPGNIYL